jgi:hypothetical protein
LIEYVIVGSYFSIGIKQTPQQYEKSNNTALNEKCYFKSKFDPKPSPQRRRGNLTFSRERFSASLPSL